MLRRAAVVAVFALSLGGAAHLAAADDRTPDAPQAFGLWANPKNSVHVEIRPCGDANRACGVVVWASDKAQQDARRGGTAQLIGLQLFRDMVRGADGVWAGRVFVPDLNRTFSGTAEPLGATGLRARGCFLRVLCRSQVWTRLVPG